MTLVVAATSRESIWMLSDRRISYSDGRAPKDDAHKTTILDTVDGRAILGYAGLGETAAGIEPADWMSRTIRGRNLTLEASLGVIADAAKKELPIHLARTFRARGSAHHIVVPAFVGGEPRLYSIDLVLGSDQKSLSFRFTRHAKEVPKSSAQLAPRFGVAGSGLFHLPKGIAWMRDLLRLINAVDLGKVQPNLVASEFAKLNHKVHLKIPDKTVGPSCIVVWRFRPDGPHGGGGGHKFFTGVTEDKSLPTLPSISQGFDMQAFVHAILPHLDAASKPMEDGSFAEVDKEKIDADLAELPQDPDDRLR
jgi:hypothetical protein